MKPLVILLAASLVNSACVTEAPSYISTHAVHTITTVCSGSLCAICADNPEDSQ